MRLLRNTMKFTTYMVETALPILGKVKLDLRNKNNLKVKSIAYVVRGGKESFLGRRDGEALGIIAINPNRAAPGEEKGYLRKNNRGFPGTLPPKSQVKYNLVKLSQAEPIPNKEVSARKEKSVP